MQTTYAVRVYWVDPATAPAIKLAEDTVEVEVEDTWQIDCGMLATAMVAKHGSFVEIIQDYEILGAADGYDPAFEDDAFTEHAREVARGDLD